MKCLPLGWGTKVLFCFLMFSQLKCLPESCLYMSLLAFVKGRFKISDVQLWQQFTFSNAWRASHGEPMG